MIEAPNGLPAPTPEEIAEALENMGYDSSASVLTYSLDNFIDYIEAIPNITEQNRAIVIQMAAERLAEVQAAARENE